MMRAYAVFLCWAVKAAAAADIVATLASSYEQAQSPTANISLVLVRPAPAPASSTSTETIAAAPPPRGTFSSTPPKHNHGASETGSEIVGGIDPGALVGVGISAALAGGMMLSALVYLLVRWRRNKKSSGDEEEARRWLRISDLEKPAGLPRPMMHAPGPDFATTMSVRDSFSTTNAAEDDDESISSSAAASNKEDLIADPATRGYWRPMPPSSPCRAPRRSRATPPGFVTGGIGVAMSSRQMVGREDSMSVVARPGAVRYAPSWWCDEPCSPALPPSLAPSSERSSFNEFG